MHGHEPWYVVHWIKQKEGEQKKEETWKGREKKIDFAPIASLGMQMHATILS